MKIGTIRWFWVSFTSLVFSTTLSFAQITNVTGDQAPPIPGAGHDYIHLLNETVSPSNGSVSLRINLPVPPSRGFSVPFAIGYDSNAALHASASQWSDNTAALSQGGWSYQVPTLNIQQNQITYSTPGGPPYQCTYYTGYIFTDLKGSSHALQLSSTEQGDNSAGASCQYDGPWNPASSDTTGGDVEVTGFTTSNFAGNGPPQPVSVVNADGTLYYFSGSLQQSLYYALTAKPYTFLPDYIEDRNGNKAVLKPTPATSNAFTVTDTTGRTALSVSGFGSSGNTVSVSGTTGTFTVSWTTVTAPPAPTSKSYDIYPAGNFQGTCSGGGSNSPKFSEIQYITLPNGQSYSFSYDPKSSLLSEVTYPSGGWVKYTWVAQPTWEWGVFPNSADVYRGPDCETTTSAYLLQRREVSFDGTTVAEQQVFTYSPTWITCGTSNAALGCVQPTQLVWSKRKSTVVTSILQNGSLEPVSTTVYTYIPFLLPDMPNTSTYNGSSSIPVESEVDYKNASGTLLRKVTETWEDPRLPPLTLTTVLDNGSTTKKTTRDYTTATVYAELQDQYDYDYGSGAPGALLKHTHIDYAAFPNALNAITDRPADVITYNGGGTRMAETDYLYDGSSIASVTATGHDDVNYPASYASRGNVTSQTDLCIGCSNALTTYTYDMTGQVKSKTDPCGNGTCSDMTGTAHTTSYSYTDSYTVLSGGSNTTYTPSANTNAYLTAITDPLGHKASFIYDFNSGQLTKSTDPNGQSTAYIYNDVFARPTQVNYPDGGKTTYAYNDSPYNSSTPSPSVTTTKAITSSLNEVSTVAFDGLGHSVETILSSDPEGTVYATTAYDGLGRLYQVSNPYRSTSDPTYGFTTYTYDALDRTTTVTHPDETYAATSYSSRATSVQDEGNGTAPTQRISQSDGLGRLISVCEVTSSTQVGTNGSPAACGQDIAGTGFLTTYQYDALNNLGTVQQGAVSRSFAYDSLSRLLSANNPESGTTSYTYDPNGNVATRIRPAPNQSAASSTVTTAYLYDVLNRQSSITYSDSTTPSVSRHYDTSLELGLGLDNTIGRLSAEYVTSPSGTMLSGKVYSYDPLGRIIDNSQCTPEKCGSSTAFSITYGYNLLGQTVSATNGQGTKFSDTYDGAAHLTTLVSSFSNANHPATLFSEATYNAFGSPTAASLGSALNEARAYDCRGRILLYSSVVFPGVPSTTIGNTPGCPNSTATNQNPEIDILTASLPGRLKRDLIPLHLIMPTPLKRPDPLSMFDRGFIGAGVER